MTEAVEIFTDGSCLNNPGPGGWAYLIRRNDRETIGQGGEPRSTNQRMELTAAIKALESLEAPFAVKLYSDSEYLVKGMTEWVDNWIQRGWKTSAGKPVANDDLWKQLLVLTRADFCHDGHHLVEWIWVPGHAGHSENELMDKAAQEEARKYADHT